MKDLKEPIKTKVFYRPKDRLKKDRVKTCYECMVPARLIITSLGEIK